MSAKTPNETLFEKWFTPDTVKQLASLNSNLSALVGELGLVPSGSGKGVQGIGRVNFPLTFTNFLETVLAADVSGVTPFYDRSITVVKAGTTSELIGHIPQGNIGSLVYKHTMDVSVHTNEFLMTHITDNNPPLINQAPMNSTLSVLGVFLGPVENKITHILTNNDSVDITFMEELQAVVMDQHFVREVFNPLMRAQGILLQDMGAAILSNGGKVTS